MRLVYDFVMQNNFSINNNITFRAKPEYRLLKQVTKEFNYDKIKSDKYINLFEDAFKNVTDKNTVIDIDKHYNYIFSNIKFPGIKYCYKSDIHSSNSLPQKVLNECSKIISNGEIMLFRNIISKIHYKDKTLENIVQKSENENLSTKFFKQLNLAEKILEKDPNSKLSSLEFDVMDMEHAKDNLKDIVNNIFNIGDFSIAEK